MVFDDRDSFAEQLVCNQHRVFAYIVTLLANRDDAEDAFQSTCLVLWKKWKEFDPSRDFFGWACGVAHNEVRNMLRQSRRGRLELSEDLLAQIAETRLRADAFLEIRSHFLSLCLERLSVGQRQLVEECYLGDKSIKVIAEEMSVSPAALTMRLQRIRKILFECMDLALKDQQGAAMTPPVQFVSGDDQLWALIAAFCDGTITAEDLDRFRTLLHVSEEARLFFVTYMDLHGRLLWRFRGQEHPTGASAPGEAAGGPWTADRQEGTVPNGFDPCAESPHDDAGSLPRSAGQLSFSRSLLAVSLSYACAALLIAVGTFAAWTWDAAKTHGDGSVATRTTQPAKPVVAARGAFAGKITGMTNCRWGDLNRTVTMGADVALGQMLPLESGRLEITYTSGAKLTLQAPVLFYVGSRGGLLLSGKVTARTPRAGDRPLLTIIGKAAIVTESGDCEFGVDVDKAGNTGIFVQRGRVEFRVTGRRDECPLVVEEKNWALVELDKGHISTIQITKLGARTPEFARGWLKGFPAIAGETKKNNAGHERPPNS